MAYELTPIEQQLLDYLREQNKAQVEPTVKEILYGLDSKEIRITKQNETRFVRDSYDVLDGLKKAGGQGKSHFLPPGFGVLTKHH